MPESTFTPLPTEQRLALLAALRANADSDKAILVSPKDTSFEGVADDIEDDETVIRAIKAVPCHY